MSALIGALVKVPLADLKPITNCRFDVRATEPGPDGQTWDEFVDSIRVTGGINVDPAKARKLPDGKYEQVTGSRRRAAIEEIAKETGNEKPEMLVILDSYSKAEALIENLGENTRRSGSLRPQDIAFGLFNASRAAKEEGKAIPDNELARAAAISKGYASRLLKIANSAAPAVFRRWREQSPALGVAEMEEVAAIKPQKDQAAAYEQRVSSKSPDPEAKKAQKHENQVKRLVSKAQERGVEIGTAERVGALAISDFEALREVFLPLPEDLSAKSKKLILDEFYKAYDAALKTGDETVENEDDEEKS